MISVKRIFILGAAAALALAAFAAQDTYSLRVNPKKDDVFKYKNTGSVQVMGMDVKAEYTSTTKVLEVTDKGTVVETGDVKGSVDVGGQSTEMPDMGFVKTTCDLAGVVSKIEGDSASPETYRTAQVVTVFRPEKSLAVGETWEWKPEANKELGTRKVEAKYTLVAAEEVDGIKCLKIKIESAEVEGDEPASVKGNIWVSAENGMAVKTEMEVKNFPLPGAPEPISGTLKQVLVK